MLNDVTINQLDKMYIIQMTKSNWGGEGAGRKQAKETNKTRVVRVDDALISLINDLKDQYKKKVRKVPKLS